MRKPLRLSCLFVFLAIPGLAAADTTPQSLPFSQDWTSDQITASDDWSGVPGITGFRGDLLAASTGTDAQTVLAADSPGVADVNANQTNPVTFTTGGVSEFALAGGDRVVALTGSGTAQAPYLKLYLNTTGQANIVVAYDVRDIEASGDNAAQQVALQYRVGNAGNFTNVGAGYVADATDVTTATKVTPISVQLPAAAENKPLVEVRIMTTNAVGNDEWVGIDNIAVTGGTPASTDPSVDAAAAPSSLLAGDSTLLTAVVTAGTGPVSTGLAVTADLAALGGSGAATMYDDGSNGDVTVGDGTYSLQVTVPAATPTGNVAIAVTVTDAETRDGSDTVTLAVTGSTSPSVDAAAAPATLAAGSPTLLTATVTAGTLPASTGLAVTADLGAIGGSSAATMYDDGTNGDASPGDGTYSRSLTVPAATAPGPLSITVTVTDAQARSGSDIVGLSIVGKVTIAQIQGQGIVPALAVGTDVITEGVVTARRANGYFIQSFKTDTDPTTAEGLFVFTGAAPPAAATVGNRVRVSGRVGQFQRSPHAYPVTQLTNSAITATLATGTTLPATQAINGYLTPNSPVNALARFQGMRVRLTTADVVGPTNAFGDFYVVRSAIPRPAREPGIAVLDTVPLPPGHAIPSFDRNPERLRIESTGLEGGTALNVDNGTRIVGLEGILYYDRGDFTLLIGDHTSLVLSGGPNIAAVPAPGPGSLRIASFNIENLSGGASVDLGRLEKLSDVFCNYLRNPDIVGLVEIGNLATAQRVAEAINDNEFGTCPDSPEYEAHMLAATGTQRLGYLVKTAPAPGGIEPRVEVLSIEEEFVGETLTGPTGSPNGVLFDRPPLHLVAKVTGENGSAYDVDVVLNHTLSLLETVSLDPDALWGTEGHRSRAKRLQQAVRVSQLVEEIQTNDPDQPLVLIGDYNAFNFSDGYVDVMGIIGGTPAALGTVLVHADSAVTNPLTNLIGTKPVAQRYSYVFEGNIQVLDQALVNDALLMSTDTTLHHARVNADFAVDNAADPTVPVRTSDHDPLVIDMVVPSFLDADLAATLTARTATRRAGYIANFNGTVANVGPMRALRPEVTVLINADPAQVIKVRASGWTCSAPIADPVGARVFCGRNLPQDPGASDAFLIQVQSVTAGAIQVGIEADTRSADVDAANDAASATTIVTP